ncbi:MAG: tetratricopeptide repeat protein, partial [Solirubrobacteraceae bacterium]
MAIVAEISDISLLDRGRECTAAVRGERQDAVVVCQRAYQDNQDPVIGVLLAKAKYAAGDKATAEWLARQLVRTSQRSDALHILGQLAHANNKDDEAVTAFEQARQLHSLEHRPWEVADDAWSLALIRARRNEFAEALQLADECIKQAQLAGDPLLQRRGHLTAAKTLIRVGYWHAAEKELDDASLVATTNTGRADVEYQRASFYQEQGEHHQARAHFEKALRYNEGSQDSLWTLNTELNLAYSLAEEGRLGDAQARLAEAALLDSGHDKEPERAWVAARIAYRQHDLVSAASLIEKYFKLVSADESVDRDDQIDVATLGAR